jgi:hypothetical protein
MLRFQTVLIAGSIGVLLLVTMRPAVVWSIWIAGQLCLGFELITGRVAMSTPASVTGPLATSVFMLYILVVICVTHRLMIRTEKLSGTESRNDANPAE